MARHAPTEASLRARVTAFPRARVLVVGDLMVDRYYAGTVRRISPEAPVPVVEVAEESQRFGGAANLRRGAGFIRSPDRHRPAASKGRLLRRSSPGSRR